MKERKKEAINTVNMGDRQKRGPKERAKELKRSVSTEAGVRNI